MPECPNLPQNMRKSTLKFPSDVELFPNRIQILSPAHNSVMHNENNAKIPVNVRLKDRVNRELHQRDAHLLKYEQKPGPEPARNEESPSRNDLIIVPTTAATW
jgi:hypothetical protein